MDDFWVEAAKQIPSLGVLVFLVVSFLKHLSTEGKENRQVAREQRDSINANTNALSQLTIELYKSNGHRKDSNDSNKQ